MDIRIFDHSFYPELNRNKLVTTVDCSHFTMGEITPGTRQNDPLSFRSKNPRHSRNSGNNNPGEKKSPKNRSFFRTFMKLMLGLKATSNTLGNPGCSKSPVFFGKNSIFMTFWVGRDTGTLDIWRNLGRKCGGECTGEHTADLKRNLSSIKQRKDLLARVFTQTVTKVSEVSKSSLSAS